MELAAIFTATPAEIDTELAALELKASALESAAERLVKTMEQAKSELFRQQATANLRVLRDKAAIVNSLRSALNQEYTRRGGWDRVYAVNNSNGHFHRTRSCRNTYVTTEWVWVTELSGKTAAEVVERTGKMSCLTCFVGLREEIEKGREATIFTPAQAKAREEQAAAAAKKAEKAAATAAKAITNPDGTPLRNSNNDEVKTLRTAWIEAVDELVWAEYSEDAIRTATNLDDKTLARHTENNLHLIKNHCESTFRIAKAIAHKTGDDLADVLNVIVKKADVKIRRNRRLADISN